MVVSCSALRRAYRDRLRRAGANVHFIHLTGTHDLYAGGGSWLRRGIRTTPLEGRPVALFLPPGTPFRLENGTGRAIVLSARQPELPAPASPKEVLSKQPLLPIAGSGKAFDPASGTWKPREAFLSSPEAILPRRIATVELDGVVVQRVLDLDYKALGICVDEIALGARQRLHLPPSHAAEVAIYFETDGVLEIEGSPYRGRGVVRSSASPELNAADGRAYLAIAYAGPKPTT